MKTVSTKHLKNIPEIDDLKKLLKSLATLDLIISPEWDYRYYSFNSKWDTEEEVGSMRNGSGDSFFVLFTKKGCFIKGFAHEHEMSSWNTESQRPWPGLLESVPEEFSQAKTEPAFSMNDISFCYWRRYQGSNWHHGDIDFPEGEDPDGSRFLLKCFDLDPETYKEFAEDYFEIKIPLNTVKQIYGYTPLNEEMAKTLNPEISLNDILEELEEIGYPIEA